MGVWWRNTYHRELDWDPSVLVSSNKVSVLQDWSGAVWLCLHRASQHFVSHQWISSFLQRMRKDSFALISFLGFHERKALYVLFPCQLGKKQCCRLGDFKHCRLNSLEMRSEL